MSADAKSAVPQVPSSEFVLYSIGLKSNDITNANDDKVKDLQKNELWKIIVDNKINKDGLVDENVAREERNPGFEKCLQRFKKYIGKNYDLRDYLNKDFIIKFYLAKRVHTTEPGKYYDCTYQGDDNIFIDDIKLLAKPTKDEPEDIKKVSLLYSLYEGVKKINPKPEAIQEGSEQMKVIKQILEPKFLTNGNLTKYQDVLNKINRIDYEFLQSLFNFNVNKEKLEWENFISKLNLNENCGLKLPFQVSFMSYLYYYQKSLNNKIYLSDFVDSNDLIPIQGSVDEIRCNNGFTLDARQYLAVQRYTEYNTKLDKNNNEQLYYDKVAFLMHGVGTGKTVSSLAMGLTHLKKANLKDPLKIVIIAPKGLFRASFLSDAVGMKIYTYAIKSYSSEIDGKEIIIEDCEGLIMPIKNNRNLQFKIQFISVDYDSFIEGGPEVLYTQYGTNFAPDIIICDEAHRLLTNTFNIKNSWYIKEKSRFTVKEQIYLNIRATLKLTDEESKREGISKIKNYILHVINYYEKKVNKKLMIEEDKELSADEESRPDKGFKNEIDETRREVNSDDEDEMKGGAGKQIYKDNYTVSDKAITDDQKTRLLEILKMMIDKIDAESNNAYKGLILDDENVKLFNLLNEEIGCHINKKLFELSNDPVDNVPFTYSSLGIEGEYDEVNEEGVKILKDCTPEQIQTQVDGQARKTTQPNSIIGDWRFHKFVENSKQTILLTGTPFQKSGADMAYISKFLNSAALNKSGKEVYNKDVVMEGFSVYFPFYGKKGLKAYKKRLEEQDGWGVDIASLFFDNLDGFDYFKNLYEKWSGETYKETPDEFSEIVKKLPKGFVPNDTTSKGGAGELIKKTGNYTRELSKIVKNNTLLNAAKLNDSLMDIVKDKPDELFKVLLNKNFDNMIVKLTNINSEIFNQRIIDNMVKSVVTNSIYNIKNVEDISHIDISNIENNKVVEILGGAGGDVAVDSGCEYIISGTGSKYYDATILKVHSEEPFMYKVQWADGVKEEIRANLSDKYKYTDDVFKQVKEIEIKGNQEQKSPEAIEEEKQKYLSDKKYKPLKEDFSRGYIVFSYQEEEWKARSFIPGNGSTHVIPEVGDKVKVRYIAGAKQDEKIREIRYTLREKMTIYVDKFKVKINEFMVSFRNFRKNPATFFGAEKDENLGEMLLKKLESMKKLFFTELSALITAVLVTALGAGYAGGGIMIVGGVLVFGGAAIAIKEHIKDICFSVTKYILLGSTKFFDVLRNTMRGIFFKVDSEMLVKHTKPYVSVYNYDYNNCSIDVSDLINKDIQNPIMFSGGNTTVNSKGDQNNFPNKCVNNIIIRNSFEQLEAIDLIKDDYDYDRMNDIGCGIFKIGEDIKFKYYSSERYDEKVLVLNAKEKEELRNYYSTNIFEDVNNTYINDNKIYKINKNHQYNHNETYKASGKSDIEYNYINIANNFQQNIYNLRKQHESSRINDYLRDLKYTIQQNIGALIKKIREEDSDKFNNNAITKYILEDYSDKNGGILNLSHTSRFKHILFLLEIIKCGAIYNDGRFVLQPHYVERVKPSTLPSNTDSGSAPASAPASTPASTPASKNVFEVLSNYTDEMGGVDVSDDKPGINSGSDSGADTDSQLKKQIKTYHGYLPVVYCPTKNILNAFMVFLNEYKKKYICMHYDYKPDELDKHYKAGANITYPLYEFDTTNRVLKPNDSPICIIISPEHTEGFSFTWSPSLFSPALCSTAGDQKQVYGRILRKYRFAPFVEMDDRCLETKKYTMTEAMILGFIPGGSQSEQTEGKKLSKFWENTLPKVSDKERLDDGYTVDDGYDLYGHPLDKTLTEEEAKARDATIDGYSDLHNQIIKEKEKMGIYELGDNTQEYRYTPKDHNIKFNKEIHQSSKSGEDLTSEISPEKCNAAFLNDEPVKNGWFEYMLLSERGKGNNYLKYDKQIYQYLGGTQYDMKSVNTFYNSKYSGYDVREDILGTNQGEREYFNARNIYTCGTTLQYQLLQELGLQLKWNYDPEEDNVDTYIRTQSIEGELKDLSLLEVLSDFPDEYNGVEDDDDGNIPHLYDKPGINDLTSFANIKLIKGDTIYQNPFYQSTLSKMLNCGNSTFTQWRMLNPTRNLDKIKSASSHYWDKLSIGIKNMFENSKEIFQKTLLWLAWKFGDSWHFALMYPFLLTEALNNAIQQDYDEADTSEDRALQEEIGLPVRERRMFAATYLPQNDLYQRCIQYNLNAKKMEDANAAKNKEIEGSIKSRLLEYSIYSSSMGLPVEIEHLNAIIETENIEKKYFKALLKNENESCAGGNSILPFDIEIIQKAGPGRYGDKKDFCKWSTRDDSMTDIICSLLKEDPNDENKIFCSSSKTSCSGKETSNEISNETSNEISNKKDKLYTVPNISNRPDLRPQGGGVDGGTGKKKKRKKTYRIKKKESLKKNRIRKNKLTRKINQ